MKKLGLLFMVLVIALAGLGAAYAAWLDEIVIRGTVETGDVDIEVVKLSDMEVYKDLDTDDMVIVSYVKYGNGTVVHEFGDIPANPYLVAWTDTTNPRDDVIEFEMVNLFPCIDFEVDAWLHYTGSIPAKINAINWEVLAGGNWINPLIASGDIMAIAREWDPATHTIGAVVEAGYQLHYCDWIYLKLKVHIPQDEFYMDKSGRMRATLEVVQWNEYPHIAPTPVPSPTA
jgi:hypothetical protein